MMIIWSPQAAKTYIVQRHARSVTTLWQSLYGSLIIVHAGAILRNMCITQRYPRFDMTEWRYLQVNWIAKDAMAMHGHHAVNSHQDDRTLNIYTVYRKCMMPRTRKSCNKLNMTENVPDYLVLNKSNITCCNDVSHIVKLVFFSVWVRRVTVT